METQQQPLVQMDLHHGQFSSCWNHQRSENLGFKGVMCKQFYFKDPVDVETWMRANMNNLLRGLFVDIISFIDLFVNESYIDCNKILKKLYMYNKVVYGTKAD